MNEIPIHVKKLVKEYTAGTIKPDAVELTPDPGNDIAKDIFKFTLPTFSVLGDLTGAHEFAVTLESLVATKARVLAEFEEYTHQVDAFVADYDALIAVLQDVSDKKKAK